MVDMRTDRTNNSLSKALLIDCSALEPSLVDITISQDANEWLLSQASKNAIKQMLSSITVFKVLLKINNLTAIFLSKIRNFTLTKLLIKFSNFNRKCLRKIMKII